MNFQEGTVVRTQINHPPVTLSGVVIASKKIETEEERTFEVFKVMFQNESKNVGTYVWVSDDASNCHAESGELIYTGENHRDCPMNVTKAQAQTPVAQGTEQRTSNPSVVGSNPTWGVFLKGEVMLDFIFTILSVGLGLFFGTMLVDWYRKNSH